VEHELDVLCDPAPTKTVVSLTDSPGVATWPIEIPWEGHPVGVTITFPARKVTHYFHWDPDVFIPGCSLGCGIADRPTG
jgi:hypothetical protein